MYIFILSFTIICPCVGRSKKLRQRKSVVFPLPEDPMMLFSFINTKLRDCYSSLDELCDDMNVNKETIVGLLQSAGFEYSAEHNKFW